MAETDIIQNMIYQLGQSQSERMPKELGIHYADIDERSTVDLLLFAQQFGKFVNFYDSLQSTPADWKNFFPYDETTAQKVIDSTRGDTTPHLSLLIAFAKLYEQPREMINRLTGQHLDFYFKDVLRLAKKASLPHKVHVVLELKKNALPISIEPQRDFFTAGKDSTGNELLYDPTHSTVINTSGISSLRSIYLEDQKTVRCAPIANSLDGVGGKLTGDEPKWFGFGRGGLPRAEVGFAIASPVLRMKEGIRKITVQLTISSESTAFDPSAVIQAFDAYITGEKSWVALEINAATFKQGMLQFEFQVPEKEKAIVDYSAAIHGYSYAATAPVLQVLLKADNSDNVSKNSTLGYSDFKNITLKAAQVFVDVTGITSLNLESDAGGLDPKKAFLPFGPQPVVGSRFFVGYDEALSKVLSDVNITLLWKGVDKDLKTYYAGYDSNPVSSNSYFTAKISYHDGGNSPFTKPGVSLFDSVDAANEHSLTPTLSGSGGTRHALSGDRIYALNSSGSTRAFALARSMVLMNPVFKPFLVTPPELRNGFITLELEKNFLHSEYRKQYVAKVLAYTMKEANSSPPSLNEPYTPTVQSISLSYKAQSDLVDIGSTDLAAFSDTDIQFYHIAYFGQMREHGYLRWKSELVQDTSVSLLPQYENEGELLIGISKLNANDSVCLLFQVAEGSADPDLKQVEIAWSVLCDNYWKPLSTNEVVLDTTNHLRTSGVITFVIPDQATTQNSLLPTGNIWLRAAIGRNIKAVCQLIEIAANAVELQLTGGSNSSNNLTATLAAGKITKLRDALTSVKSIRQPYASFGGRPLESDTNFSRRVSERLRHKNRCITHWDYERIILEAFPSVHKVKCIPHAKRGSWLAPGSVLIVVIPDLKNKNAIDSLQPKVNADMISDITEFVRKRCADQIKCKVLVKNPTYQKVQFGFKVKFLKGYEFNYYSQDLQRRITELLSPWAFEENRDISFGAKVHKSVVLDFVEGVEYVDYLTDFKMYTYTDESEPRTDIAEASPATPDAILVSADSHLIDQVVSHDNDIRSACS